MAKRTLYFEINTTKWAKEFLSSFHSYQHFIGSTILVFNGKNRNEYMYTNEGIVNLSVPGARQHYFKHGFDYTQGFFSTFNIDKSYKIHKFSMTIDDKAWTFALRYGVIGTNKITNTIKIPSGLDTYKIVCNYENGFNPNLVVVERYADKVRQQQLEEISKQTLIKLEQDRKKQAESEKFFKEAQIHMGTFTNTLNSALQFPEHNEDYQAKCDELYKLLEKVKKCKKDMPYTEAWTNDWIKYLSLLEQQYTEFYDYALNRLQSLRSLTIFEDEYGKIKQYILDSAKAIHKDDADRFIETYITYYDNKDWLHFCTIDTDKLLYILWFYALHKPFDSPHFAKADILFNKVFHNASPEPELARWYAMLQVSSENLIQDKIRNYLSSFMQDYNKDIRDVLFNNLHRIASGLMWMKAFKQEEYVLQYMLKSGILMNAKEQERLKLLSTSNGIDINSINNHRVSNSLNIRMDTLEWKSDDYTVFFDNLSFQDKQLKDALAIRDENKDITLSTQLKLPSLNDILKHIQPIFEDEYGDVVTITNENAYRLSLEETEEMDGFLIVSDEVNSLGIFVLLIRIGKKLNIKFYSLYMPEAIPASQQAKKAISMFKKLSPTVTMWETSLKDTFLVSIQQVLNSASLLNNKKDTDEIEQF